MASPPKPWERNGAVAMSSPSLAQSPMTASTIAPSVTTADSDVPQVPTRPSTLTSSIPSTSTAVSPYNSMNTLTNSYASPYSSYNSPYNRFGSYTSPYGGYGGGMYGGGYGGYGSYGGGYGGYGMGGFGAPQPMVDPITGQPLPSLTQQVQSSTAQTFSLIQSIVGTFSGFAQMLDSTFMATHSSFFAMIGVAEQLGQLKIALGQVFGMFGLVGWLRGWWKGEKRGKFKDDFRRFLSGEPIPGAPGSPPQPSKKPLIVFLLAAFGLPYLMNRLIRSLSARLPPPTATQLGPDGIPIQIGPDGRPFLGPDGRPIPAPQSQATIDPANLTFVRAMHPFDTTDPVELKLAKGELAAVLSTIDPVTGTEGEWWRGRTRDGREGWFPRAFVEIVKKKESPPTAAKEATEPAQDAKAL